MLDRPLVDGPLPVVPLGLGAVAAGVVLGVVPDLGARRAARPVRRTRERQRPS